MALSRTTRIVGLCGSLRAGSYNRRLLEVARGRVPPHVELSVLTQQLADLPAYSEDVDNDDVPAVVTDFRAVLARADGLLIATPEYNASIPGFLKNAIDWASRPFPHNALEAIPVVVIGASTGPFGAVWAQAELRKVLRWTGAQVIERELAVASASGAFRPNGLTDAGADQALSETVASIVQAAQSRARQARP